MAESEFDPNKIAAEVVIQATEQAISAVVEPIGNRFRRLLHAVTDAYGPFLEKTFLRVSTIRTFLKPTESVDLLGHYVPVGLTDKVQDYVVEDVIQGAFEGGRYIISGLAGRGKSVLMRYVALSMYHAPRGKIPLFLELRNLNNLTSKNLLQLVHSQYKGESSVSFNDFLDVFSKGYFALILDGFDEISPQDREVVEGQLLDISLNYEKASLIVSGRPDERFQAWEKYKILHLKPMSLAQTRLLIERSTYDVDVKKVFLKRLTKSFFEKHESFLNTPLLAIMLMLTFEEYAEIPISLHEFYRNAFDTLIRRHDAMKAQFLRQTHSGCTAEEFKKIFASFCLLTYSKSVFTFHKDEILEYIDSAIRQQRLKCSKEQVLEDLVESICLLQQEGFEISFVHRSFQEYFCALFVSSGKSGLVAKYLDSGKFRVQDDVIPMLFGMAPDRVESEWANAVVENICNNFGKNDPQSELKFVLAMYPEIELLPSVDGVGPIIMQESPLSRKVSILKRMYPDHFVVVTSAQRAVLKSIVSDWEENIKRELHHLESIGDPQFQGIGNFLRPINKKDRGSVKIKLEVGHKGLLDLLYGKSVMKNLSSIRSIQREQKSRARGDDNFLNEVFEDI